MKTSGVPEIPGGFLDDAQILVWFTNTYKRVGEKVYAAMKTTEDVDPTTLNLLQEVEHGIAERAQREPMPRATSRVFRTTLIMRTPTKRQEACLYR